MLSMIQQMENFCGGYNSDLFYEIVYKKFLNMLLSIRGFDAMIFEKAYFYLSDRVLTIFRAYFGYIF